MSLMKVCASQRAPGGMMREDVSMFSGEKKEKEPKALQERLTFGFNVSVLSGTGCPFVYK